MVRFVILLCLCLMPAALRADPPEVHCSGDRWGAPVCILQTSFVTDTCDAIQTFATRHALNPHFFVRLIWQESRFDPNALSPAGAQGIAQFMPGTARLRGLDDPFNPADALEHSAQYLAEMTRRFGNLGLAAVGYNGGERRARGLIDGTGGLARETVDYVRIVTGVPHPMWLADPAPAPDLKLSPDQPFDAACRDLASNRRLSAPQLPEPLLQPWGIQMAHGITKQAAAAKFAQATKSCAQLIGDEEPDFIFRKSRASPQGGYIMARLGRMDRDRAWRDCTAFKRAGCVCVVYANDK